MPAGRGCDKHSPRSSGSNGFVDEARAFCAFVEKSGQLTLGGRLVQTQAMLLRLYQAALSLPSDRSFDSTAVAEPQIERQLVRFGRHDFYREVFDPYVDEAPVGTTLSDDIGDVYADVRRALVLWDAGNRTEAVWQWRFYFDVHWGDHAIDALRALHRAVRREQGFD